MPPPDPMKQTLHYDQLSCRLSIEGLPDVSVGQGGAMVGIITGWSLRLAGKPELEGRREHLQALLQAVLPYARCLISEVPRPCGGGERPARIEPAPGSGHRLSLRSSQEGVEPLQLLLDDAELADLVRVLDGLRLDPRVSLTWDLPPDQPLKARDLLHRVSRRRRLAAPAAGVAALAAAAVVAAMVPPPRSVLPPSPPPPPPVDRP
jgi:hypothetical protein